MSSLLLLFVFEVTHHELHQTELASPSFPSLSFLRELYLPPLYPNARPRALPPQLSHHSTPPLFSLLCIYNFLDRFIHDLPQ